VSRSDCRRTASGLSCRVGRCPMRNRDFGPGPSWFHVRGDDGGVPGRSFGFPCSMARSRTRGSSVAACMRRPRMRFVAGWIRGSGLAAPGSRRDRRRAGAQVTLRGWGYRDRGSCSGEPPRRRDGPPAEKCRGISTGSPPVYWARSPLRAHLSTGWAGRATTGRHVFRAPDARRRVGWVRAGQANGESTMRQFIRTFGCERARGVHRSGFRRQGAQPIAFPETPTADLQPGPSPANFFASHMIDGSVHVENFGDGWAILRRRRPSAQTGRTRGWTSDLTALPRSSWTCFQVLSHAAPRSDASAFLRSTSDKPRYVLRRSFRHRRRHVTANWDRHPRPSSFHFSPRGVTYLRSRRTAACSSAGDNPGRRRCTPGVFKPPLRPGNHRPAPGSPWNDAKALGTKRPPARQANGNFVLTELNGTAVPRALGGSGFSALGGRTSGDAGVGKFNRCDVDQRPEEGQATTDKRSPSVDGLRSCLEAGVLETVALTAPSSHA